MGDGYNRGPARGVRRLTAQKAEDARADLGEAPRWDDSGDRLLWVDVHAGLVMSREGSGPSRVLARADQPVTAALPRRSGGLLCVLAGGLATLGSGQARPELRLAIDHEGGSLRANDAAVAPDGSVWFGTMHLDGGRGRAKLFRIDRGGRALVVRDGLGVSNGLGWSPDGAVCYHVDTADGCVWALALPRPGEVPEGEARRLVSVPADAGKPDGLCVDAQGCVWIALWGGGAVWRVDAEGRLDTVVDLPTSHPTSCAFGGPDRDRLYVTTAARPCPAQDRHAGALFVVEPGTQGRAPSLADVTLPGEPGATR